jgi:hypothetical protein
MNQLCVELTALVKVKIKAKFTLEEATKAQRGSRCIALYSFINLGARCGWVVNAMPPAASPLGKTRYLLYRRLGGSRACLDGCGKYRLHRDLIPVLPSPWRITMPTELSRLTLTALVETIYSRYK